MEIKVIFFVIKTVLRISDESVFKNKGYCFRNMILRRYLYTGDIEWCDRIEEVTPFHLPHLQIPVDRAYKSIPKTKVPEITEQILMSARLIKEIYEWGEKFEDCKFYNMLCSDVSSSGFSCITKKILMTAVVRFKFIYHESVQER